MGQPDQFELAVAGRIDLADDRPQPGHIAHAVRNDEHVGRRVGRQMAVLGDQGAQDRHQLGSRHIVDGKDPCDDIIGGQALGAARGRAILLGVDLGDDLNGFAGRYGRKTVNLQHGEECLVHPLGAHGRGRQDGDLALHARIDNEVLAGDLTNRRDQCVDIGVLEIQRGLRRRLRADQRNLQQEQRGGQ